MQSEYIYKITTQKLVGSVERCDTRKNIYSVTIIDTTDNKVIYYSNVQDKDTAISHLRQRIDAISIFVDDFDLEVISCVS